MIEFNSWGGVDMATSSILTNIKITDPKKVEDFVEALDIWLYSSKYSGYA